MKRRATFPGDDGIYRAVGSIVDTYYLNDADAERYIYLRPAYPKDPHNRIVQADCWIVDREGNINPGTAEAPVPFYLDALGERIAQQPREEEL